MQFKKSEFWRHVYHKFTADSALSSVELLGEDSTFSYNCLVFSAFATFLTEPKLTDAFRKNMKGLVANCRFWNPFLKLFFFLIVGIYITFLFCLIGTTDLHEKITAIQDISLWLGLMKLRIVQLGCIDIPYL